MLNLKRQATPGFPKVGRVEPSGAMSSKQQRSHGGPWGHNLKIIQDILKLMMNSIKEVSGVFSCRFFVRGDDRLGFLFSL